MSFEQTDRLILSRGDIEKTRELWTGDWREFR